MKNSCAARMKEALKAGQDRNYRRAIELLSSIVASTNDFPEALLFLGRSYHATGEYAEAIQTFQLLLSRDPEHPAADFFLGRSLLSMGEYYRAIHHFSRSLQFQEQAETHSLLGLALLKARFPDQAVEAFAAAVSLDPDNARIFIGYLNALMTNAVRLFRIGETDLSRQMFHFLLDHGNQSVVPHVYLASIYRSRGEYAQALNHYNKALLIHPDDNRLAAQRAALYEEMGQVDKARREFDLLRERDPEMPEFAGNPRENAFRLAVSLFEEKQYTQVVQYCRESLKRNSNDTEARLLMAETFRALGDLHRAENHIKLLLKSDRYHVGGRYSQLMILWQQDRYEEIPPVLNAIIDIDPHNQYVPYYRTLCACKLREEAHDENIRDLEGLLPYHEPDLALFRALGEENEKAGKTTKARNWFEKALQVSPEDPLTLKASADLYLRLDKPARYRRTMETYLETCGNKQDLTGFIRNLIIQKDWNRAIRWLRRLQRKAPLQTEQTRVLAYCLRKSGQNREAAILYRSLLLEDHRNAEMTRELILCLYRAGLEERARALAEKASSWLKSPLLHLILGDIYYAEGRSDQALEVYRKVTANDPKNAAAYEKISRIYANKGDLVRAEKFAAHADRYR